MQSLERLEIPGSGLQLIADAAGAAHAPSILFLHGSGQTRHSWGSAVQEAASRGYRAVSLDLRGHGDSDWSPDGHYGLEHFVADTRQVIERMGGKPVLVGASLGGIIGLLIAADPPPVLRALVLVDITPRVEVTGTQEVIAFMDSAPRGFASLEEAADAVSAYLPHRQRPKSFDGLKRNLRLRDGRYYWHWDPAFMQLGRASVPKIGEPNPLEIAARKVTIPTLLIRGGRSRIVSQEGVNEFRAMVPHAELIDISDAHHMVAGDANDTFNDAVLGFVAKLAHD
jgi:pimeloyl-ACP methyl ester carboxylesterase